MTVATEQVREFLSNLPAAAFPLSNGMLAHLAHASDTPAEAVAVLSDELPEGKYKSPQHVLRAISNPAAARKDMRTNASRGKRARSRPRTTARRAS